MHPAIHLAYVLAVTGCASDEPQDPQVPPTGSDAVTAWLAAGYYQSWACEPEAHDARSPSPHNRNRICSNDIVHATPDGSFAVSASSVKELLDDSGAVFGHAVSRKLSDDPDGAGWYWYEAVNGSVTVEGTGASGSAKSVCVGCHVGAAQDFVFAKAP